MNSIISSARNLILSILGPDPAHQGKVPLDAVKAVVEAGGGNWGNIVGQADHVANAAEAGSQKLHEEADADEKSARETFTTAMAAVTETRTHADEQLASAAKIRKSLKALQPA